jgi:hypothetical protein
VNPTDRATVDEFRNIIITTGPATHEAHKSP